MAAVNLEAAWAESNRRLEIDYAIVSLERDKSCYYVSEAFILVRFVRKL